jgi:hypothetical protein
MSVVNNCWLGLDVIESLPIKCVEQIVVSDALSLAGGISATRIESAIRFCRKRKLEAEVETGSLIGLVNESDLLGCVSLGFAGGCG